MKAYAESQFVAVGDHARIANLRRQGWEVTPLPGYHGVFSMLAWKGEKMKKLDRLRTEAKTHQNSINRIGDRIKTLEQLRGYHAQCLSWVNADIHNEEKRHANSKRSRSAKARDKRKAASPKVPKRAVQR